VDTKVGDGLSAKKQGVLPNSNGGAARWMTMPEPDIREAATFRALPAAAAGRKVVS
jgi:hypothetical protein